MRAVGSSSAVIELNALSTLEKMFASRRDAIFVMMMASLVLVVSFLSSSTLAYSVSPQKTSVNRREAIGKFVGATTAGGAVLLSSSSPALASGGATAGKYTCVVFPDTTLFV